MQQAKQCLEFLGLYLVKTQECLLLFREQPNHILAQSKHNDRFYFSKWTINHLAQTSIRKSNRQIYEESGTWASPFKRKFGPIPLNATRPSRPQLNPDQTKSEQLTLILLGPITQAWTRGKSKPLWAITYLNPNWIQNKPAWTLDWPDPWVNPTFHLPRPEPKGLLGYLTFGYPDLWSSMRSAEGCHGPQGLGWHATCPDTLLLPTAYLNSCRKSSSSITEKCSSTGENYFR